MYFENRSHPCFVVQEIRRHLREKRPLPSYFHVSSVDEVRTKPRPYSTSHRNHHRQHHGEGHSHRRVRPGQDDGKTMAPTVAVRPVEVNISTGAKESAVFNLSSDLSLPSNQEPKQLPEKPSTLDWSSTNSGPSWIDSAQIHKTPVPTVNSKV